MGELVSIVIPSYNSEMYIIETLQSVMNQTYDQWECLIIDDGSTDNTQTVVKTFIATDPRFSYHYQQNKGLAGARNTGIALSQGKYLQFLDSDDVIFPDKLERMMQEYQSNPNAASQVYFSDFNFTQHENPFATDEGIRKLHKDIQLIQDIDFQQLYNAWDLDFVIPTHSFLFPKKAIVEKRYDETLKSKEDWDFYLSMLSDQALTFNAVNFVGCGYRLRPNSMSQDFTTLLQYALIIAHKWKRKKGAYLRKISFYYLQAYIYLVKKKKIRIKTLNATVKELHGNTYFLTLFLVHILMPLLLVRKITSLIYSRK